MSPLSKSWHPSTPLINEIIGWVRQAGYIALRYFTCTSPQRKLNCGFSNKADLGIEQFLVNKIRSTFPEHGLVTEAYKSVPVDLTQPIWTLDPLDGSTSFAQGLPGWGISISMLHLGQPRFGLFFMPLINDLTYTSSKKELYSNEQKLRQTLCRDWNEKGFLAVGASVHHDFQIKMPRTRTLGSIGAGLVYAARGAAVAVLITKARLWDLAAGAAILIQAGGELRYLSGQTVGYMELLDGSQVREPILAGHPELLTDLQQAIRPWN